VAAAPAGMSVELLHKDEWMTDIMTLICCGVIYILDLKFWSLLLT